MKTNLIIWTYAILGCAATASAQYELTSSVIAGGGRNCQGGGFSLCGTAGQAEVHHTKLSSASNSLLSGFWGLQKLSNSGGYASWAAINIPPGQDASFDGDANGDNIPNGIAYIFGGLSSTSTSPGVFPAPLTVPNDASLIFALSTNLIDWNTRVEWIAGVPSILSPDIMISGGQVSDAFAQSHPTAFWRYGAILLTQ